MLLYTPIPAEHEDLFYKYVTLECEKIKEQIYLKFPGQGMYPIYKSIADIDARAIKNCGVIWTGIKWEAKLIERLASFIVLPRRPPRKVLIEKLNRYEIKLPYLFLGMQNLDELIINKPFALCTRVPFAAAIKGVELARRERRPKKLKPYALDKVYPDHVLTLAERNFNAIHNTAKAEEGK